MMRYYLIPHKYIYIVYNGKYSIIQITVSVEQRIVLHRLTFLVKSITEVLIVNPDVIYKNILFALPPTP